MPDKPDDTNPLTSSVIEYHHIKSNHFRVVHIDGGVGGITPRGFCHIALYNERAPIPRVTTRNLIGPNEYGPEQITEVRGEPNTGIVREVEVDLIFDEQTARQIREWLDRRIEEFETRKATLSEAFAHKPPRRQ